VTVVKELGRRNGSAQGGNVMRIFTTGKIIVFAALLGVSVFFALTRTHAAQPARMAQVDADKPFAVEYYYKTRWGRADEFLALFKKNHYPILKKEMEMGRILEVRAAQPRYHSTEDGRWDYRTTIIFKNAAIAEDNFDSSSLAKQLYPDQETFKKEEQRRFEILEAHWDVPLKDLDLNK
jgi:hypothetical protein